MKSSLCNTLGVTLLIIPFWWDKQIESVAKTIHLARPDIPLSPSFLTGSAIPSEMPPQKLNQGSNYCD